jgi:hypothetical protein
VEGTEVGDGGARRGAFPPQQGACRGAPAGSR